MMYRPLILVICLMLIVFSGCRREVNPVASSEVSDKVMEDIKVPENFSFSQYSPDRITVDLKWNKQPFAGGNVVLGREQGIITRGFTDVNGRVELEFQQGPPGEDTWIQVETIGFSHEKIPVNLESDLRDFEIDGYVPVVNRGTPLKKPSQSQNDLPDNLVDDVYLSPAFLEDINRAFPERQKLHESHPEYIMQGNLAEIVISDQAEVFITFVHEGAGYRNTLGYFAYQESDIPGEPSHLIKEIAFPNVSLTGSGGSLTPGMTVSLGSFTPGTRIGFFLIANGWNGSNVNYNMPNYYSISDFNPENDIEMRQHLAILYHPEYEMAVMGFEDINRENTGCDHDFNDALFSVSWNPIQAVEISSYIEVPGESDIDADGISDNNDAFPNDPDRAFVHYFPAQGEFSLLAFEDLFPSKGDYDLNDLVIESNFKETRDGNLNLRDIEVTFVPLASGASLSNGFGFSLGAINQAPDSVYFEIGNIKSNRVPWTLHPNGELTVTLFSNIKSMFEGPVPEMINTNNSASHLNGDTISLYMAFGSPVVTMDPPYNPYIFRSSDPGHETHLPGYPPTPYFNTSLFNKAHDDSNPGQGRYFVTATGLPWAVHLTSNWNHPVEQASIQTAYPKFQDWVESGGSTDRDWYQDLTRENLQYIIE